ncbi:MAG: hypothetical protein LBI87_11575 [Candidatus Accumulibacter sp.]|jgi:hypothetical protein|nr:hypothetical protein [Accumulibacter sp.]
MADTSKANPSISARRVPAFAPLCSTARVGISLLSAPLWFVLLEPAGFQGYDVHVSGNSGYLNLIWFSGLRYPRERQESRKKFVKFTKNT